MACSKGRLFVARSGDARQLLFWRLERSDGAEARPRRSPNSSLAFGGLHFLDPTCTYNDLQNISTISPGALPHPPLTKSSPVAPSCPTSPLAWRGLHFRNHLEKPQARARVDGRAKPAHLDPPV